MLWLRTVAWFALWRDQCYKCSSWRRVCTLRRGCPCRGPCPWGGYLPTQRWPVVQVINVPPRQPSVVTCQRQCYKCSNWQLVKLGSPSWQAFQCLPQCTYQTLLARALLHVSVGTGPALCLTRAKVCVCSGRVLPCCSPQGGLSLATACRRLCPVLGNQC